MNKKISMLILAALTILLLTGLAFTEGYNREFKQNELGPVKGSMYVEDGQETAGLFSQSPCVSLPKGTYRFQLYYKAQAEGSSVAVYTDETGVLPVYAHPLPAALEEGEWTFDCHFDQDATNLRIAVDYSGNGAFSVEQASIRSQGLICTDVFAVALFLLALAGGYRWFRKGQKETETFLCPANIYLILTLAAFGVSIPILNDYVMGGGDVPYHLNRIEGIRTGLLSGQFPVRIHSGTLWGYGYGSSLFYPELLLYFPALLRLCGVTLVTAAKLYLISVNLLAGWLMYLAARRILDGSSIRGEQPVRKPGQLRPACHNARLAGLVAALLFLTAVFRLGEGYIDAAYGQFSSMAFLPLLLLGVYELLIGDERRWGYAAVGFTLVFQTHILSAVWSALLILAAALTAAKQLCSGSRLLACAKAAGLTVLLNLWFLLPMLYMMREPIRLDTLYTPFTEYAVPFSLLFKASPEIGFTTARDGMTLENVLPLTIGLSLLFSNLLLALPKCQGYHRDPAFDGMRRKARILFGWGAAMVFMASRAMPWKLLARIPAVNRFLSFTQFPWRFLAFAITFLCISGAAALVMTARESGQQAVIFALAFAVALFPMTAFLDAKNPEHVLIREAEIIASDMIAGGEYLYKDTDTDTLSRQSPGISSSSEQLLISDFQRKNGSVTFHCMTAGPRPEQNIPQDDAASYAEPSAAADTDSPLYADIPLLYYPGYRAWLDGQEIPVERSGQNLVRVILPADSQGTVEVRYKGKRSWNLAAAISAVSMAGWGVWLLKNKLIPRTFR